MTELPPVLLFAWVQSFAELEKLASEHAVRLRAMDVHPPFIVRTGDGYIVEFQPGGGESWAIAHDGMYLFYARVSNPAVIASPTFLAYTPVRHLGAPVGG